MLWPPRGVYTDFASNSRTGLRFEHPSVVPHDCDIFWLRIWRELSLDRSW
jgi:hypothetical protein